MAPRVIFHHNPGSTVLHRLDPRTKLLLMLALAATALLLPLRSLMVLALLLPLASALGRVHPGRLGRSGLAIWILVSLVFLSRALGTPGDPLLRGLISLEGILLGARDGGRLIFLIFLGHLFLAVTSVSDIQRAVRFFLGPRIALLVGLTVSWIPALLDTAGEVADAAALRGLSYRKRPLTALLALGSALLGKTAERALAVAEALEARNYRYDRSEKPLEPGRLDIAASSLVAAVILTAFLL